TCIFMRIGLYNDSFPPLIDGVANTIYNYAKYINKNHGQAVVVTPKYRNVTDDYDFDVYRYSSISSFGMLPYRVGNSFSPATIVDLNRKELDLLHVHCPFSSAVLAYQQNKMRRKKIPVVFTYHTKFDVDIDKFVRFKKFNSVAKKFVLNNIKKADEVWVVSEGAGRWLETTGYNGRYVIMPNGTDFKKGKASAEQLSELERIFRLDGSDLVFLFVGRMMWYKNIKLIIDSLDEVRKAGIKFKMFFVGEGRDRSAIEDYVKKMSLSDSVIFTGAICDREQLRVYFSRADLFIFPSTYDTSGLVVKEAAACYCPSLLVKNSCAAESAVDGISGFITEESVNDCARKIIDVCRQPQKLKEVGITASEKIYLSWEDAVARAYNRYEVVKESFIRNKKRSLF
ncbi:MAG: glycosyltransferase, partial [bacterium]|nr:glycosyltransferase [bacterium]